MQAKKGLVNYNVVVVGLSEVSVLLVEQMCPIKDNSTHCLVQLNSGNMVSHQPPSTQIYTPGLDNSIT